MPPPDDDQQRRVEIEIAVRDSMSTFLKTAAQALESFNRELIKTGSAGQTSLEEVRKRFQLLEDQGKKTSGSFGGLGGVFGGISKSISGPLGVVALFAAAAKGMEEFAKSSLQLSHSARDLGFSVGEVNRASQQAARAGIEPERAAANLAKTAAFVKDIFVNPTGPNAIRFQEMNKELHDNVVLLESQGKTMQAVQLIQASHVRASGPEALRYQLQLQDLIGFERSWIEASKDRLEGVPPLWEANEEAAKKYLETLNNVYATIANYKKMALTGLFTSDVTLTGAILNYLGGGPKPPGHPGPSPPIIQLPKVTPEEESGLLPMGRRPGQKPRQGALGKLGKLFSMSANAAEVEGGGTLGGDAPAAPNPIALNRERESLKIEEDTNQSLHEIRDVLARMEERGTTLDLSARRTTGTGGTGGVGGVPPMGGLPGFPRSGGPPPPVGAPAPAVPFGEPILPGGGIPRGIPSALEPFSPFGGRFGGFAPVGAGPSGMFPQLGATQGFPGTAVSGGADIGAGPGSPIEGILWAGIGASRDQGRRRHAGFDVSAPIGTPIKAEEDGVIVGRPEDQGSITGGIVKVRYKSGVLAKYMHLSNWSQFKEGDKVSRGQVVGLSGTMSTPANAHLHVEYYGPRGERIDPAQRHGWGQTGPLGEGLRGRRVFTGIPGSFPAGTTQQQAAAQRGGATAALAPWPIAAPMSAQGQTEFLQQHRAKIMEELRGDPEKMRRFMGLVQAEAGGDAKKQQAMAEGIIDRWAARGQTVYQGIGDKGYYGENPTMPRGGITPQTQEQFPGIIAGIEKGSAMFPGATGNASAGVLRGHFARGEVAGTLGTGRGMEGFINEQVRADIEFRKKLFGAGAAKPPSLVQQRFGEFWNKDEPSTGAVASPGTGFGEPGYYEARKALRDENEAKSRAMINGKLTDGSGSKKEATVAGKVDFGDKKSAFEGGETKPFIDLDLGRTAQAGQAGSTKSFANRFAFE